MLTKRQYKALRARYDRRKQWRNGRASYQSADVPKNCRISNEEISAIDVYEFMNGRGNTPSLVLGDESACSRLCFSESRYSVGLHLRKCDRLSRSTSRDSKVPNPKICVLSAWEIS